MPCPYPAAVRGHCRCPRLQTQSGPRGAAGRAGEALVQLADLVLELRCRAVDDRPGHDGPDRERRDRGWCLAPRGAPGAELLGAHGIHDPAQGRPAVRGRAHRAVLAGGVDGGRRALRRGEARAGPAGDGELRVLRRLEGQDVVVVLEEHGALARDQERAEGLVAALEREPGQLDGAAQVGEVGGVDGHATLPVTRAKVTNAPSSASSIPCTGEVGCPFSSITARSHSSQFAHASGWLRAVTWANARLNSHWLRSQSAVCHAADSAPTTLSMCSGISPSSRTSVVSAGVATPSWPPGRRKRAR